MKKNLYTKTQLAKQVKELIKVRPLKNMTIQYIADSCGINRGTFYYHFCDRQELINWIYHNDITVPIQNIILGPINGWKTIALVSLKRIYTDKAFYLQAAKLYTHNNLIDFMKQELELNWRLMIQRYIDLNHLKISPRKADFYADFMANGVLSMIVKWINTGMQDSPEPLANMIDTITMNSLATLETL